METKEVDGVVCTVVHISENRRRGYAICTGNKFDIPDANDKKPKLLCEACRQEFLKGKK